jgi:hypothetical protein
MENNKYVELVQNGITLVRDKSHNQMTNRLKKLGIDSLLSSRPQIKVVRTITNINKPIGSIFEGSI